MNGLVEQFGCDAIFCPVIFYAEAGRQQLPGILGNLAALLQFNATWFHFIDGTGSHGFGPT